MPDPGLEARVAAIVREEIRALAAYHVPDAGAMVKLDAMENPYRLPQDLRQEIAALVAEAPLNRYPDAAASVLKQRLREFMRLPPGIDLMLGNGSDEIIQLLMQ